jgi:serine/threonine protein phosphatase PrpC
MEHGVAIAAVRGNGQDRAGVFDAGDDVVIALADGAGGNGNGATASRAVIDAAAAAATAIHDWCALLAELDRDPRRLGHGESTAVIVSIRGGAIAGASVGDSGAWLVRGTDVIDLTEGQLRKPLVGGGCAPFRLRSTRVTGGTLLVASDGLFNYAKPSDIVRLASGADLTVAARALVELVRLPNGALQDDVAVVLCRERA